MVRPLAINAYSLAEQWNWNLEMLVLEERGRPESPDTNSTHIKRREPNTQTWATLVGSECSHHCDIPSPHLLHRQECFRGKYTARKIHTKLHPGPEWRIFHVLTCEYIDDVISRSFTAVRCKQSVKNGE